jgi:hypothetical protein
MHENLANMAICEPSRVPDKPGGCHELSRVVVLEPASVATGSAPPRLSGSGHYVTESVHVVPRPRLRPMLGVPATGRRSETFIPCSAKAAARVVLPVAGKTEVAMRMVVSLPHADCGPRDIRDCLVAALF